MRQHVVLNRKHR